MNDKWNKLSIQKKNQKEKENVTIINKNIYLRTVTTSAEELIKAIIIIGR